MITAKQAYENYVVPNKTLDTEKFVKSVLEYVITDEHILEKSVRERETSFSIWDVLDEVFIKECKWDKAIAMCWKIDGSELPEGLRNKSEFCLLSELEELYETRPQNSVICQAFRALVHELEVVRGFKVKLNFNKRFIIVSWNLSHAQNTQ